MRFCDDVSGRIKPELLKETIDTPASRKQAALMDPPVFVALHRRHVARHDGPAASSNEVSDIKQGSARNSLSCRSLRENTSPTLTEDSEASLPAKHYQLTILRPTSVLIYPCKISLSQNLVKLSWS